MKLYLLKPIENLEVDHWDPWYDKAFGFVVRAETEFDARHIANNHCGDEDRDFPPDESPWLSAEFSTCTELSADGESEMILRDLHSA